MLTTEPGYICCGESCSKNSWKPNDLDITDQLDRLDFAGSLSNVGKDQNQLLDVVDLGSPVLPTLLPRKVVVGEEEQGEVERYKPAYELDDEMLERAGRSTSNPLKVVPLTTSGTVL